MLCMILLKEGWLLRLYELAAVTNKSVHIHFENILFLPEALKLCSHYNLNPLGCISSGSLIVVANLKNSQKILNACRKSNLPGSRYWLYGIEFVKKYHVLSMVRYRICLSLCRMKSLSYFRQMGIFF